MSLRSYAKRDTFHIRLCDICRNFQKTTVVKRKGQGKSNMIFDHYYAVHLCPRLL